MMRIAFAVMSGVLGLATLQCRAESACAGVAVRASVEAETGALTLADLLERDPCPQLRTGSVRVLEGPQIRRLVEGLRERGWKLAEDDGGRIPGRIVVRHAGAMKSCEDIAKFIAHASAPNTASAIRPWDEDLDCAAAQGIPEDTPLELLKSEWSARMQRWEFALRCARPEDCVPFLVWARAPKPSAEVAQASPPRPSEIPQGEGSNMVRLVNRGQTATLTWEQAGIRIILPVTCLEAGGLGQFVRVRFQNAARTLRAEVVGAGVLRVSL